MIFLHNTLTRQKEEFKPLIEGEVKMYHCGPTVYHFQHIGNMRRFIFADLIHRLFVFNDYKVEQIINITDVGHLISDGDEGEDKMEKGAKREGKTAAEIANLYTADFMEDLGFLNILASSENTRFPKATDYIPEQINLIKKLEEKGFTYQIEDGIYFDTSKDLHYADFARLDIEGLKEGARVEANHQKRNITDFALWKFSRPGEQREQEWKAPWGVGFPGWHIECSAIAMHFLGEVFDIHTGGIDHIPVHHTNEIAQSECATGKIPARYWMHNEHLNFGDEKMAKSGESFIRLKDIIKKGHSPLAFRYLTLLAHYSTKISFSYESLKAAETALARLQKQVTNFEDGGSINEDYKNKFLAFINDDIDTPQGVALIWTLLKDSSVSDADKKATILDFDRVLGLSLASPTDGYHPSLEVTTEIQALINERNTARQNKNWEEADRLRKILKEKGAEVNDKAL